MKYHCIVLVWYLIRFLFRWFFSQFEVCQRHFWSLHTTDSSINFPLPNCPITCVPNSSESNLTYRKHWIRYFAFTRLLFKWPIFRANIPVRYRVFRKSAIIIIKRERQRDRERDGEEEEEEEKSRTKIRRKEEREREREREREKKTAVSFGWPRTHPGSLAFYPTDKQLDFPIWFFSFNHTNSHHEHYI